MKCYDWCKRRAVICHSQLKLRDPSLMLFQCCLIEVTKTDVECYDKNAVEKHPRMK